MWPRSASARPTAGIMCPDAEPPLGAADEVSMIIRHPQVVDGLVLAGIQQILDRHPLAVVAQEPVAGRHLAGTHPALVIHEERVLRRGADHLAADLKVEDATRRLE